MSAPHRRLLDEAHYFLSDPDALELLDLELNGYTLVTYIVTKLNPALLATVEVVIVTRQSDPHEIEALRNLCEPCGKVDAAGWIQLLETLVIGQAVAPPLTEAVANCCVRLPPRLTTHVRHLTKYIDVPVWKHEGFVFWRDGALSDVRARTLREFVEILEQEQLALRPTDISEGMTFPIGSAPSLDDLRSPGSRASSRRITGTTDRMTLLAPWARAVRSRYEFLDPIPGPGAG